MRARQRPVPWICAALLLGVAAPAVDAQVTNWDYDFTGWQPPEPPEELEAWLGPGVGDPLDAKAYGYPGFGVPPNDPLRNFNLISQVFQADHEVTIGTGENGTEIVLHPGDYTFAYTLDYTGETGGEPEASIWSFQLYRVIQDRVFHDPPILNPGPFMALDEIKAGGYYTASGFEGPAFKSYPEGVTGEECDYVPDYDFQTSEVEFLWDASDQVEPRSQAMVFLFTTPDIEIMQIGWNPVDGYTGEGGVVLGGDARDIPVLVPAVPEPGSILLLLLGGTLLLTRRGRCR